MLKYFIRRQIKRAKARKARKQNSYLKDKIVVCFGDSIWAFDEGNGIVSDIIKKMIGGKWFSCAVGGTRLTDTANNEYKTFSAIEITKDITNNDWSKVQDAIKNEMVEISEQSRKNFIAIAKKRFFNDVDILVYSFGTNDILSNQDIEYVKSTVSRIINMIKDVYPHIQVVFSSTYSFEYNGDVKHFNDEIRSVVEQMNCVWIDMFESLTITKKNRYIYTVDGIHLSDLGHVLYSGAWCLQYLKYHSHQSEAPERA